MTNFPSDGILETVARIALFFTLLFSYPVLFHPTRSVINELCVYTYEICRHRSESLCIQSSDSDEETLLTPSNSMFKKKERNMMYRKEIVSSTIMCSLGHTVTTSTMFNSLSLSLSVSLSVCFSLSVCLSLSVSVCLCLSLSLPPSLPLSLSLSLSLPPSLHRNQLILSGYVKVGYYFQSLSYQLLSFQMYIHVY